MNYGWPVLRGARTASHACGDATRRLAHDHSRTSYRAIVGGYVVRDPGLPTLAGRYLYGDNCNIGSLRSDARSSAPTTATSRLADRRGSRSFGEDACGRLYAASLDGPVYRIQDGAATPCTFAPPTGGSAAPTPRRRGSRWRSAA